jgi:hypothetical protein
MPDSYPENNDGDSVFVDPTTGETYFRRISRPNYTPIHPGETDGGRLSRPNYEPVHPGELQNQEPVNIAEELGWEKANPSIMPMRGPLYNAPFWAQPDDARTNPRSFSDWSGDVGQGAVETVEKAADAAADAGGGLWRYRALIIPAVLLAAFLWLARPLLELGANVSGGGE